ncbi:MAG: hypothetical protein ACKOWG_17990, partial [Planctomycetia bacterium]
MKRFGCMPRRLFASLATAGLLCAGPKAVVRAGGQPAAEEIDALIAGLGADDYAEREAAAAKLNVLGAAAVDPLLAAAELSDDLEIALRARWLVDTIPLETERDPPEVAKLLDQYKRQGFAERVQVLHRLLRVDDDGGIEPLARIVRLDRSAVGSRVAAALLAREWQPDDPAWAGMRDRIAAGLGGSVRPAASFLRSVVSFSSAADEAARSQALLEAGDALTQLTEMVPRAAGASHDDTTSETVGEMTLRIFNRCRLQMLITAGSRAEALAEARRLLRESVDPQKDAASAGEAVADTLVWLVERGLPEAVDLLAADRPELIRDDAVVGYAAALAERARHRDGDADRLAAAAFAKPAGTNAEFIDRLQTAMMLVRWGAADWAAREYTLLVEDPRTPAPQYTIGSIMFSEFLHDQERDDEAAVCLRRLLEGRDDKGGVQRKGDGGEQMLQQFGHDPRSRRSRMHYFESCAAAAKGDAEARRRAIEASVRAYARDVDALIWLYPLPENTPAQTADAVARIRRACCRAARRGRGARRHPSHRRAPTRRSPGGGPRHRPSRRPHTTRSSACASGS